SRALDKPKKSVRRRTAGVTIDEVAALAGVSPMTFVDYVRPGQRITRPSHPRGSATKNKGVVHWTSRRNRFAAEPQA
ncbi:hypothetical protein C7E25_22975, partial [Stenotrophomonas maltophilia]